MSNIYSILNTLHRPKILLRAAKFGLSEYCRERDLSRIIPHHSSSDATVKQLLSKELQLEQNRLNGEINYCVTRHIEVLVALLAEVKLAETC